MIVEKVVLGLLDDEVGGGLDRRALALDGIGYLGS